MSFQAAAQSHAIHSSSLLPQNEPLIIAQQAYLLQSTGEHFELIATRHSPVADYYTWQQMYQEVPIENIVVKTIVPQGSKTAIWSGSFVSTAQWPLLNTQAAPNVIAVLHERGIPETITLTPRISLVENTPQVRFSADHNNPDDRSHTRIIFDADGTITAEDNFTSYFTLPDTLAHALVFLPDPITSAETDYFGDYKDFDDADNDALNNERFEVMVPAQFIDDTFFLQTDNILLRDLNAPTVPVVTALTDSFLFTRSESGFEDVNTVYHLTTFQSYLESIGYASLADFYIEVDPHGASGADQSFYVSGIVPSMQFGEGGVDDAEDADVIVHEYTHALSDYASPESNIGLERKAVDEGYGDYFAVSYSRSYSDYKWEEVYTWDGHNEFWFGRNADTDKHYPEDNSDNYYAASEIWSGALMDIYDLIGKNNCDQLVSEALYGSLPNMTMPEAAQVVLIAENLLFGGSYYDAVYGALDARGLINPIGITSLIAYNAIQITNTAAFSAQSEPLMVTVPAGSPVSWIISDIAGKILHSGHASGTSFTIAAPANYNGMALIHIYSATESIALQLPVLGN